MKKNKANNAMAWNVKALQRREEEKNRQRLSETFGVFACFFSAAAAVAAIYDFILLECRTTTAYNFFSMQFVFVVVKDDI